MQEFQDLSTAIATGLLPFGTFPKLPDGEHVLECANIREQESQRGNRGLFVEWYMGNDDDRLTAINPDGLVNVNVVVGQVYRLTLKTDAKGYQKYTSCVLVETKPVEQTAPPVTNRTRNR